jgi:predicted O-linked N-acetylglucosamine transferase (SPINDLY family)
VEPDTEAALAEVPKMVASADAMREQGDFSGAEQVYCRILDLYSKGTFPNGRYHPVFILFRLGRELESQGSVNEAAVVYTAAVNARPDQPAYKEIGYLIFMQLGGILIAANRLNEALDCFDRAMQVSSNAQAHVQRGVVLQELGRFGDAEKAFNEALATDPDTHSARFGLCTSCLPTTYKSEQELANYRERYAEHLNAISEYYSDASQAVQAAAAEAVGMFQPFYLPYQGFDDRDLQKTYGALVCNLMAARFPEYGQPKPPRPRSPGHNIRVGFVSRYHFSDHSVWKLPLRGWVEGLDRDRFDVFIYNTSENPDAAPPSNTAPLARCLNGPRSTENWCAEISADDLDALIYPEFGMDPVSIALGALRLAPLQMTSLGHPVTSGMRTIDIYLSSDYMEPANGQEHYTEQLVRLPHLGFTYSPPAITPDKIDRSDIGVAEDEPLFWCCQSLYKLLPRDDDVFPRIAGGVGRCKIAFIEEHRTESTNTPLFKARLAASFKKHGLSMEDYCIFLPHMSTSAFAGICRVADVFLDGIAWSGCNTSFEAIAQDLPIVTLAGGLMRARHAQALLRMMGATDTITSSKDAYVETAVKLATDPEWRSRIVDIYKRNKHLLYNDHAPTTALEKILTGH